MASPGDPLVAVPPADPLVRVRDLTVRFTRNGRDVHAVRGVDLDVAPGEIVGLVGESGSGKSVLGLSLLGLLAGSPAPRVSGSAVVCGVDMVTASAEERRLLRREHLGAVFQDPMTSLNPTMPVGRQVAEAAGTREEAIRLLTAVGVPDPERRYASYPHQLSGGLRQRVMIAMAIAGNPSLVVADEPTTALDVSVQAQVIELIRHLRDTTGASFVFITHDLGVAAQIADRICVLYGGRLAELGTAADVLERPSHPYTIGLLRSRLTMTSDRTRPLRTLPGEPPDPRAHPPGCAFAPRCDRVTDACHEALPVAVPAPTHPGVAACINLDAPAAAASVPVDPWGKVSITLAHYGTPHEPALVMTDVSKTFVLGRGRKKKTLHALNGVDLAVAQGEAVALVGESGSGKSTVLRIVAGLTEADRGSVTVGGGGRPQIVFQDAGASMTPWRTVGQLIDERLRAEVASATDRRDRMQESLSLVGLPAEVADAKPRQLSGGQRQRAALARAIVVPPALLLCDEPTSALDVSLAANALNLIGRLRRELGMSVLFVTHDLAAARLVADRVAVMYLGRIVETGPAAELATAPTHPYTAALLAAVPEPGRSTAPLEGEPANPLFPPGGCAFHPRCPRATDRCRTEAPVTVTSAVDATRAVACHHPLEA